MAETAEPSFAERRAASRLGIAIAAIIPMITTTINNSISEKPFWCNFIWTQTPFVRSPGSGEYTDYKDVTKAVPKIDRSAAARLTATYAGIYREISSDRAFVEGQLSALN